MGSLTPNLELYKPDPGEVGWAALVDENWDKLDTPPSPGGEFPQSALMQIVDPVDGLDSNNGRSPGAAKRTIAAALADLQSYAIAHFSGNITGTLGIGKLVLLPGDATHEHDPGGGLAVDYRYPVEIIGQASGHGYAPSSSAVRLRSSSSSATELIKVGALGGSTVGYGFAIRGVTFVYDAAVNTAMTALLRVLKTTRPKAHEIYSVTTDSSPHDVPLIEHDGGTSGTTDGASFQWLGCIASNTPLIHLKGGNINRGLMSHCECQFGAGATYPMVWLDGGGWACTFIENALEGGGSGPAVRLSPGTVTPIFNMFINNGGEAGSNAYPFYDVVAGGHNIFDGGGCSTVDGSSGEWIKFGTNAYPNKVRGSADYIGAVGFKRKVTDNSDFPATNTVEGPRGRIYRQKTGATPSYNSGDFPAVPPDGTIVGTTKSDAGERRVWAVIGGTFVSWVAA